jgi:hypothetical protein
LSDDQELNDKFVRMVGGVKRADRLQQIWNSSFPHYKKSREEDFREKAKAEGYIDKQIEFFLNLP